MWLLCADAGFMGESVKVKTLWIWRGFGVSRVSYVGIGNLKNSIRKTCWAYDGKTRIKIRRVRMPSPRNSPAERRKGNSDEKVEIIFFYYCTVLFCAVPFFLSVYLFISPPPSLFFSFKKFENLQLKEC